MLTEAPTFYKEQTELGTKLVGVNETGMIIAGNGNRSTIATCGLGTCTAIAVIFECTSKPDVKGTIISHYMPQAISMFNVESTIRVGSEEALKLGIEAKALIVSPGTEDTFSPTRHSPQSTEEERIEILTRALKNIFGKQTQVSKVGYEPWKNRGWIKDLAEPKERGTVLVEYLPGAAIPRIMVDGISLNLPLPLQTKLS